MNNFKLLAFLLVLVSSFLSACGGGGDNRKKLPVNQVPSASADAYELNQGTVLSVNAAAGVLANDSDPESNTLEAELRKGTDHGLVTLEPDGSFVYTPQNDYQGDDTFIYRSGDGSGFSNEATVTLTIKPVAANVAPVAGNDAYTVDQDGLLSVAAGDGVLSNDFDNNSDALNAVLVGTTGNGLLSLNADGSFTYEPNSGFVGEDTFTYHANDGSADSNTATVTITVTTFNQSPTAFDDNYSTNMNTPLFVAAAGVLGNDTDPESNQLSAILVDAVSGGLLALNENGSFDFTPVQDFFGSVTFTYKANDGTSDSANATVTIEVRRPPSPVDDTYGTDEDTNLVVNTAEAGVLGNDIDHYAPADLSATLVEGPANGTLKAFSANGTFTYAPNKDFNGADSFKYQVVDGVDGSTAQATVTINVKAVNDAPVAADDSLTVAFQSPYIIDISAELLFNDTDVDQKDTLSLQSFTTPANGQLADNGDGTLTYTPNGGFSGPDNFNYTVSDGLLADEAAVAITVEPLSNHPPKIVTGVIGFTPKVVDATVDKAHAVAAADFNGDGITDLVGTDFVDGIFWYEGLADGGFLTHVLDATLAGAYPASVADLDGDGDTDVLAAGYAADGGQFVWYENNGSAVFTRRDIDLAAVGAHSIWAVNMDDDQDLDLITTMQDGNTVAWYENDGNQKFTRRVIDGAATGAKMAAAVDLDKDGDMDVVAAIFGLNEIAWYENNGSLAFTKHSIDTGLVGAYYVEVAEMTGDSHLDILATNRDSVPHVSLYRNNGTNLFTGETIDAGATGARTVVAADIDADGIKDAVATSVDGDFIGWYKNDGTGSFTRIYVARAPQVNGPYGVSVYDVDRDGDLDVASASRDKNEVAVHYQTRIHNIDVFFKAGKWELVLDATYLKAEDIDIDDGPGQLTYTYVSRPIGVGELRLNGAALSPGETFTQADIDAGRVSFFSPGSGKTTIDIKVADGGEFGAGAANGILIFNPR